jgi:glucose-1-phosphatase
MITVGKVKVLLFDLGGVIIDIDFDRIFSVWATHSRQSKNLLKNRFKFDEYYERHERGEINGQRYFASLRQSLNLDLTDDQFIEGWNSIYIGELPGIRKYLSHLCRKFPLYAFTNSNPIHQTVWQQQYRDVLELFHKIYISSEMGTRKPEPESFGRIASEIGVPLHGFLFFDDTEENVMGARSLGMQAVHVRSISDIEEIAAVLLQ